MNREGDSLKVVDIATKNTATKQDGASLTGSFEALEAMAEDGVKTIVFQTIGTNTPGAVSRVSVDALLSVIKIPVWENMHKWFFSIIDPSRLI